MPEVTIEGTLRPAAGGGGMKALSVVIARFLTGLAAISAVGGLQGASAQVAPGRSGGLSGIEYEGEVAMSALMKFGRCYAERETEKALRLIATDPTSLAERRTYIALFRNADLECLRDMERLSADVPLVRGAIAEGLYTRNIPLPAAMMQSVPTLSQIRDLSGVARCYVASHREEVRALLAETSPGGRKEREALSKLAPDFLKCVPPGAAKLKFSSAVIRFRLAEAMLRTAPAPAGGS
jgi:hypothetical protein